MSRVQDAFIVSQCSVSIHIVINQVICTSVDIWLFVHADNFCKHHICMMHHSHIHAYILVIIVIIIIVVIVTVTLRKFGDA